MLSIVLHCLVSQFGLAKAGKAQSVLAFYAGGSAQGHRDGQEGFCAGHHGHKSSCCK